MSIFINLVEKKQAWQQQTSQNSSGWIICVNSFFMLRQNDCQNAFFAVFDSLKTWLSKYKN